MPNIYEHIDANKRGTVVVITFFVMIVAFLGWFVGEYFLDGIGTGALGTALIISGVTSLISYYNSDKIVLGLSGARELKPEESEYIHNLVENLCIASGIPKPKIYIINDSSMNAFATGRDPAHSSICLTTGIISRLEKRELEGVIAHEMSHIGNFDIRLMSIVSILVGTIQLLSDFFTRGRLYRLGGRRSGSNSGSGGSIGLVILIFGVLMLILSPLIASLIQLAISRKREYLADSTAALITRYPKGLADALRKLSTDTEVLEVANGATAHLFIVNPIREGIGAKIVNLFSTHPPIEERINRLETM